jgi:hypothetical protein
MIEEWLAFLESMTTRSAYTLMGLANLSNGLEQERARAAGGWSVC